MIHVQTSDAPAIDQEWYGDRRAHATPLLCLFLQRQICIELPEIVNDPRRAAGTQLSGNAFGERLRIVCCL